MNHSLKIVVFILLAGISGWLWTRHFSNQRALATAQDALRAMELSRESVEFDWQRRGCPPSSQTLFAEHERRRIDADLAVRRVDSRDAVELQARLLNDVMLFYSKKRACLDAQIKFLDRLSPQ